ncbi:MAG: hypothetical protein LUC85_00805 [Bacteroidales bacterium]|nr:hypothetical protein [Bacteroidales bacterium]
MKKLLSILTAVILTATLAGINTSCAGDNAEKLANDYVEAASKSLPLKQSGITVESCKLQDKVIVFQCQIAKDFPVTVEQLSANVDQMRVGALMGIKASSTPTETSQLIELAKAGYSVKYVYDDGDTSLELVLTDKDLLDTLEGESAPTAAPAEAPAEEAPVAEGQLTAE